MRRRALVVDDEAGIRLTLSTILELNGFFVQTAASGREAKETLLTAPFDVIITDLKMETERSGFDVAAFAANMTPRPVTVVMSAYPKLALHWQQQGVHAFFEKPTPTDELLRVLDELLTRHDAAGTSSLS